MDETADSKNGDSLSESLKRLNETKDFDDYNKSTADELENILSSVNQTNPVSANSLKGKYKFIWLENLSSWQEPLGQYLNKVIVVCGAKVHGHPYIERNTTNISAEDSSYQISEEDGPLPLQFDSLLNIDSERSIYSSVYKLLSEKYFLYPITGCIARKLLSLYDSIQNKNIINTPLAVISHGRSLKTMELIGSARTPQKVHFRVINKGSVSHMEQLPRLSSLKSLHLEDFPPSFTSVETTVFTRYDFLENETEQTSLLKPDKNSSLHIECSWSNTSVSSILEPLPDDCTCVARVKCVVGDDESGAFLKFKEIKFIEALYNSLQTGWMSWSNSSHSGKLMERLTNFLNEERVNLFRREKVADPAPGLDSFDKSITKERVDLDFTDKLWLILKDCSSSDQLKELLSFVYIALNEFLDAPFVSPKNMSSMAIFLKNANFGHLSCPPFDEKLAIQYLLEIGIEKLKRDYITFFLSMGLVPFDYISKFLHANLLSAETVCSLKKLHSVLELTVICVKRLLLPKELLSAFVRNALKYYASVPDIDLNHEFSVHIPSVKGRQLLNQLRPTVWEVSFVSELSGFMKQTIHHYQTTPTHDHIYAPKDYHPKLMLKTALYTYLTGVLIQDDSFKDLKK